MVSQSTQRVGDHGAYLGPQVYAARELTLEGWIVAPSMAERQAALSRLHRSLPVNALSVVKVSDAPERYVRARVAGQIKAARIGQCCYQLQIPMVCPDPRKYGLNPDPITVGLPSPTDGVDLPATLPLTLPERVNTSSGVAVNGGDMEAPWAARIVGPIVTPGIEAPGLGRQISINLSLGFGETLDLDSRDRTVVLNGSASRSGLIVRGSSWFTLPPESTTTIRLAASGTAGTPTLTFTALAAWS